MASVPNLRTNVLLRSEQTAGQVSVIENVVPAPSAGPHLHTHDFDEAFYILEGELVFQVEDELIAKRAGEIAFAPRNVAHTLANHGDAARATCSSARRPGSSATSPGSPPPRRASSRRTGRCSRSPRSPGRPPDRAGSSRARRTAGLTGSVSLSSGSSCSAWVGMSAAPTMTRQKAMKRAPICERAGADRLVEDEDAAEDGGQVRGHRGEGDDLDGRPELEAAGGRVEGDHARQRARSASMGSAARGGGPGRG